MDELPFLVVLIRKIRAAVIWIVAAILAILLIIDYMENEEVAYNIQFLQTLVQSANNNYHHMPLFIRTYTHNTLMGTIVTYSRHRKVDCSSSK